MILAVVVVVLLMIVYLFFAKQTVFAPKYTNDEKEVSTIIREVNKFFTDA